MSERRMSFVVSASLMASIMASCSEAEAEGPYPTETGMVEYEVTGMQSGTMIRYWRDWGYERAEYQNLTMSMAGITQETNHWTIANAENVINIDQAVGTGTIIANPVSDMYNMTPDQMDQVNQTVMQGMGGQLTGTEVIAGQECEVWTLTMGMGGNMCLWSGVELRNAAGGPMMTMTATTIDTDTPVSDEHFTVSDNINLTEPNFQGIPQLQDLMQGAGQQ